jgi:hypothetical protein
LVRIVDRFFLVWTTFSVTFSLDARRPSGVAVDARSGTGDGVGGDTRMRDEIALVERARVVVADDGARARRDAVARATTRRLILTFETTGRRRRRGRERGRGWDGDRVRRRGGVRTSAGVAVDAGWVVQEARARGGAAFDERETGDDRRARGERGGGVRENRERDRKV